MSKAVACLVAVTGVLFSAPVLAQEKRVEVSFLAVWTLSDGVTTVDEELVPALDGNLYNRLDPKDSFKWGFTAGFLLTENVELGFQYGQQDTTLVAGGEILGVAGTRSFGDLRVSTYHGYVSYTFFGEASRLRPYATIGLGATHYASVSYEANGVQFTTRPATPFSWSFGTGVKYLVTPHLGIRGGVQLTTSDIRTDGEGWWCDPNAGSNCYGVAAQPQFASQWDFGGGVFVRF
jgi:outer membrane protein W